jgi:hypothetical protein
MVVVLFALVDVATAAPARRVTWADWVGEYTGEFALFCDDTGPAKRTVSIDVINGVFIVDLTSLGKGLPGVTATEQPATFVGLDTGGEPYLSGGDAKLVVMVHRARANAVKISLMSASGCDGEGTLVRASAKVAECDALIGWARIENKCTKIATRSEDLAALHQITSKRTSRKQCAARAKKLENTLFAAGCAPDPDPPVVGPQCKAMLLLAFPPTECRTKLHAIVMRALEAPRTAKDPAEKKRVEASCRVLRIELEAARHDAGC